MSTAHTSKSTEIQISSQDVNLKAIILVVYCGQILSMFGEAACPTLIPPEAESRGINETLIGVITGTHPILCILITLYMSKHLGTVSRKGVMAGGVLIQGVGYVILALVKYLPNNGQTAEKAAFVVLSLMGRIMSGCGIILLQTPGYSIVPTFYPETYQVKIGLMEMFLGLGFVLGCVQEMLLYRASGYVLSIMVPAAQTLIVFPLILKYIPSNEQQRRFQMEYARTKSENSVDSVKQHDQDQQLPQCDEVPMDDTEEALHKQQREELALAQEQQQEQQQQQIQGAHKKVSYVRMMTEIRIIPLYLLITASGIVFTYLTPTYALYLQNTVKVNKENTAFFFGIGFLTYTIFNAIAAQILNRGWISPRLSMTLSMFGTVIANFFLPPCGFTGLSKPTAVQQALVRLIGGCIASFTFVPAIPLYVSVFHDIFPDIEESIIHDAASSLFLSSWNLGEILGPIIGGVLVENTNFTETAFITSCIAGCASVFFFVVYYLLPLWRRPKDGEDKQRLLEDQKQQTLNNNPSSTSEK